MPHTTSLPRPPTVATTTAGRRRRCPSLGRYPMAPETVVARSQSNAQQRPMVRLRIDYEDDAVYTNMLANMYRLLRVAQQLNDAPPATTSALLAQKALQYRKLLTRAQAADVDDPAFDVASFMGVAWAKKARNKTPRN